MSYLDAGGIADRSISVAITATEQICRKDFSMDPSEQNLRRAAHQMMRSTTAAMASITCREPLFSTMVMMLKQFLANSMGNVVTGSDQARMVEEAAHAVTEANINVTTNFIVKTTCEKAVIEIEKRLEPDYLARRAYSKEDKQFQVDPEIVEIIEKMPEAIRLKEGPVSDSMMKVYDDFSS